MNPIVPPIATTLSVMTVATDVLIVLYFLSYLLGLFITPIREIRTRALNSVVPIARIWAFIIALVAMSGSLFYSDVAKYTPCLLCWWQRIFMYPQVIIILMGIVKNDKNVADYAMGLSAVGILLAAYHYYIQLGGNSFFTCSQIGFSVACDQRFSLEFGYVTIPMMSLSAFISIFLLMRLSKKKLFS